MTEENIRETLGAVEKEDNTSSVRITNKITRNKK